MILIERDEVAERAHIPLLEVSSAPLWHECIVLVRTNKPYSLPIYLSHSSCFTTLQSSTDFTVPPKVFDCVRLTQFLGPK